MLSGGDRNSPVWTCWGAKQRLRGILWASCCGGHRKMGVERDWSPNQGALRSNQRVSRGQSWGGLSGGLWDNLWPYGFGLEIRRAYRFRCNHSWTCLRRQSLMLKTQRMGNSRGLSFNRLLWPTNCKVLQGHFACVIQLTSLLVEGHRSSGLLWWK